MTRSHSPARLLWPMSACGWKSGQRCFTSGPPITKFWSKAGKASPEPEGCCEKPWKWPQAAKTAVPTRKCGELAPDGGLERFDQPCRHTGRRRMDNITRSEGKDDTSTHLTHCQHWKIW